MKYIITTLILSMLLFVGCTTDGQPNSCEVSGICDNNLDNSNTILNASKITVDKIEVYHFHGASQCFSCETIKSFAEETVNLYYKDLLDSGKMEFRSIDVSLPENKEIVNKYGATGSSLWIGTYINGKFLKEQDTNVWYKVNDEEGYKSYLKGILDKRLEGKLV
ncbi:nitrophenyl compound nitroreductase subunit ArsF family protein [Candidatus Woesearchaeota archaeon]|nr:nitrophenyl compound nitroreductase subunit ArsF family protein [Candidatus Woesearchaeota archaeon]